MKERMVLNLWVEVINVRSYCSVKLNEEYDGWLMRLIRYGDYLFILFFLRISGMYFLIFDVFSECEIKVN